jgi:dihydropteroate synthase-like protein
LKALLITGKLAEDTVKQYAKESTIQTEVLALKTQVAALLTPQAISSALKKTSLKGFDLILTPGLMVGDTKPISEAVKVPAFKGPRYAADLPAVLDALGEIKLSTTVPACDLMREKIRKKALQILEKTEQNRQALLSKPGNFLIKNVAVGKDFPMRVLAEIVDAPLLSDAEIGRLARRFVRGGADLVDVGMLAGNSRPADAKRAVKAVKAAVDVPISVDTLDPAEIEAAVEAGADLILSADAGNLEKIAPFAKDTAVVVIPTNQCRGYFPKTLAARVRLLERLVLRAKKLGFSRVIGDLVLEPANVLGSFMAFRVFSCKNPDVPLLIGVANVVELFDADSVGLNALLARLASEVGVGVLLTTEKSAKTRGSVHETALAAKMMFLAKKRESVPKELGLDMLILKDRVEREVEYSRTQEANAKVTLAKPSTTPFVADPCGVFRVAVDRDAGQLVALFFESSTAMESARVIRGGDAECVLGEVLRLGLVSRLEHAGYLGRELAKAEVALHTGRDYVEGEALFG